MAQLGGTNSAQTFAAGGVTARYVQMTVTDNHVGTAGITGGGDRVGIGELRFDTSAVPEPTAFCLTTLSLLGLAVVRRRRRQS